MEAAIINLILNVILGLIFTIFGVYACHRKAPMWFWSGSTVHPHEIRDIPGYNRANGVMWLVYSLFFWLAGILYFWFPSIAIALMVIALFPGFLVLIWNFYRIKRKYGK